MLKCSNRQQCVLKVNAPLTIVRLGKKCVHYIVLEIVFADLYYQDVARKFMKYVIRRSYSKDVTTLRITSWLCHQYLIYLDRPFTLLVQWLCCVQQLHPGLLWGLRMVPSELHIHKQLWSIWTTMGKRYYNNFTILHLSCKHEHCTSDTSIQRMSLDASPITLSNH